ncbi:MAG: aldo/keto reductase [Deltaproteobacteria bacterium]|jgi:aryl-alcohol dehydrogenase-like predicted oxidoreductase|nr:aldo/keto reductase [Deltaproteobacteria bacterium]
MERRTLGSTGIEVPVIGQGTWKVFNVRDDAGQARCDAVVEAALDAGANFFDSSPMYGESERVLAEALGDRRGEALVATKVWARDRAVGEEQIARALGWYEHIDLYQVHNLLSTDDHLPYLQHLKEGGRVKAIGATHYLSSAHDELIQLMRRGEIDAVQVPYHPGERWAEREIFDEATRLGIGVVVMMPLGSGRLLHDQPDEQELAPLASFGVHTWAQVLLKWVLSDDRVHVAIPATSSADHMRDNAAAGSTPWFGGDERTYVRQLYKKYND